MRVTIQTMLVGIIMTLSVLMGCQGLLALRSISSINDNVVNVATNWVPSIDRINRINTAISDLRILQGAHIMTRTDDDMTAVERDLDETLKSISELRKSYEPLISSPDQRKSYDSFVQKYNAYLKQHLQLTILSRKNENERAAVLFKGEMAAAFKSLSSDLGAGVEIGNRGAEDNYARARESYGEAFQLMAAAVGGGVLIGLTGILVVMVKVTRPVRQITAAMRALAAGQLTQEIPFSARRDELGDMARTLAVFRDGLAEAERMRLDSEAAERRAAETIRSERLALADRFEARMGALAGSFVRSSDDVSSSARALSATAEETSRQAQVVTGAAEEAAVNVQTVAASTEEMTAAIHEISQQVARSAEIAQQAAGEAARTEADVRALSEASSKIGEVVALISNIAGQTNLLALNATIEAARAGEAGRGFAVVASEVKQLASQTARATDEIGAKIAEIQTATSRTVGSIDKIVQVIGQIQQIATMIATSIEEQGAATAEIASNTQLAARGTSDVTNNINGVGQAAEITGSASTQLMGLSGTLSAQAADLQREVGSFVQQLRAG